MIGQDEEPGRKIAPAPAGVTHRFAAFHEAVAHQARRAVDQRKEQDCKLPEAGRRQGRGDPGQAGQRAENVQCDIEGVTIFGKEDVLIEG